MNSAAPSKQTVARRRNAVERRKRILAEGGRALYALLGADAAKALAEFESEGFSATTTVSELLIMARASGWMPEKPTE